MTSVIVGAERLQQLDDNLAAIDIALSEEQIRLFDQVSTLPREYPGWMLETQGADRLGPVDLWADKAST